MSNLVKTTTIVERKYLQDKLAHQVDQKLADSATEINGYLVDIKRRGDIVISAVAKSILVKLPLDITFTKPEGIFSMEGHGAVLIDARIDIDIKEDWTLEAATQLQEYTWIVEPRVKVGAINIPLETIVDAALQHKEQDIIEQLDKAIAQNIDLQALLMQQAGTLDRGIPVYQGLICTGVMQSMHLSHIKEEGDKIFVHFLPSIDLLIRPQELHKAGDIPSLPRLDWIYDMPKTADHQQEFLLELSYAFLGVQVDKQLDDMEIGGKNLQVKSAEITYQKRLQIRVDVTTPVDAVVLITGVPQFSPDQGTVDLYDLDVKVKPNNILYKLSAPIINRVIESRMEAMLPVDLNKIINTAWQEQRQQLPQIKDVQYTLDIDHLQVEKMTFLPDKIVASLSAIRPEVEIFVGRQS